MPIYRVNAFSSSRFGGNPAAVVVAQYPLPGALMQAIATEQNLSETAFTWPEADGVQRLRWFTPSCEAQLCGHATLATAELLLSGRRQAITFVTASGKLAVQRLAAGLQMELPLHALQAMPVPPGAPLAAQNWWRAECWIAQLADAAAVRAYQPDFTAIAQLHPWPLIITAPGSDCDFVYRYFAPSYGVPEDPVTGSACCALGPLWQQVLGKSRLRARQLSARGGELHLQVAEGHLLLSGHARCVFSGELRL